MNIVAAASGSSWSVSVVRSSDSRTRRSSAPKSPACMNRLSGSFCSALLTAFTRAAGRSGA